MERQEHRFKKVRGERVEPTRTRPGSVCPSQVPNATLLPPKIETRDRPTFDCDLIMTRARISLVRRMWVRAEERTRRCSRLLSGVTTAQIEQVAGRAGGK
jgi:hypothetical protein